MSALPTETQLIYEDELGIEHTTLELLPGGIRFVLRGTVHEGTSIDEADLPDRPWRNCRFEGELPVLMFANEVRAVATLGFAFVFGSDVSKGPSLCLTLHTPEQSYFVEQTYADFWDGLKEISARLPPGIHLHCCFSCQFSDYSPFGQSTFGSMICVFENRERWLAGQDKSDWIDAHGESPAWRREMHFCEHYSPRTRPAGYRGI
jgi:hypothetical protein